MKADQPDHGFHKFTPECQGGVKDETSAPSAAFGKLPTVTAKLQNRFTLTTTRKPHSHTSTQILSYTSIYFLKARVGEIGA